VQAAGKPGRAPAAPPAPLGFRPPGATAQRHPIAPAPIIRAGGVLQRMEFGRAPKRKPFWKETQKSVLVSKGEHRRHIIPSSLFIATLTACRVTFDDEDIATFAKAMEAWDCYSWQEVADMLNNYQPNLIAGPGKENVAIGMYMHSSEKVVKKVAKGMDSMEDDEVIEELEEGLEKVSGFEQPLQRGLTKPVIKAFGEFEDKEEAMDFAMDIHDNTAFDWPYGEGMDFGKWHTVYSEFVALKEGTADRTPKNLVAVINSFLALT